MGTLVSILMKNIRITLRAYPFSMLMEDGANAIFSILFPFFTYTYIFRGALSDSFTNTLANHSYLMYLFLGQIIATMTLAALFSVGNAVLLELHEGTFQPFLLTPCKVESFFIASYMTSFLHSFLQILILSTLSYLLGLRFSLPDTALLLVVIGILMIGNYFSTLILMVCTLWFHESYLLQSTIVLGLGLLSGIYFPISLLPSWLQYLSFLFPLRHSVQFTRMMIFHTGNPLPSFLYFLITSIAWYGLAKYLFATYLAPSLLEKVIF